MASRIGDVPRATLYLLASFPLGVAYVVFLAAGASIGTGLLLLVVGVFVLAGTASIARRVAVADAAFTAWLFGTPVPALAVREPRDGLFDTSMAELTSLSSYRAVAYLLARFFVGVGGFVVVVTWLALAGSLLAMPVVYDDPGVTVTIFDVVDVETLPVALALGLVGVVVAVVGAVVVAAIGRSAARTTTFVLTFGGAAGDDAAAGDVAGEGGGADAARQSHDGGDAEEGGVADAEGEPE